MRARDWLKNREQRMIEREQVFAREVAGRLNELLQETVRIHGPAAHHEVWFAKTVISMGIGVALSAGLSREWILEFFSAVLDGLIEEQDAEKAKESN